MPIEIVYSPVGRFADHLLTYVVMITQYREQWLLVRHRERITWEIPGGHIEPGEAADDAARRELYEETGAAKYHIAPICDYSVTMDGVTKHGRLYTASIETLGALPESEIAETKCFEVLPENLTYPDIQPALLAQYLNTR